MFKGVKEIRYFQCHGKKCVKIYKKKSHNIINEHIKNNKYMFL